VAGRWSLLPEREPDPTVRAHALARTLLDRHGVVTRGAVAAEGVEGGFSAVYRILSAFEDSGQARRGYVVEGLGAAQFAMDGAVDRLRATATARDRGDTVPVPAFADNSPGAHGFPDDHAPRSGDDRGTGHPPGRRPARGPVDGSLPSGDGDADLPWGFTDGHDPADAHSRTPALGPVDVPGFPDLGAPLNAPGFPDASSGHNSTPYPRNSSGHPGRQGFAGTRTRTGSPAVVLAAADPANAYGAALSWPDPPTEAGHKPGRKAGSLVVLVDGELALYMERGGKTLLAWPTDPNGDGSASEDPRLRTAAEALAAAARAGSLGTVTVERVNGASALTSPLGTLLEGAGFIATPRGLRLRA
jgi:ATP-dependent Lhr-like helicase